MLTTLQLLLVVGLISATQNWVLLLRRRLNLKRLSGWKTWRSWRACCLSLRTRLSAPNGQRLSSATRNAWLIMCRFPLDWSFAQMRCLTCRLRWLISDLIKETVDWLQIFSVSMNIRSTISSGFHCYAGSHSFDVATNSQHSGSHSCRRIPHIFWTRNWYISLEILCPEEDDACWKVEGQPSCCLLRRKGCSCLWVFTWLAFNKTYSNMFCI